ncbi:MAG: hypothetical protein AABW56_01350 [Nanoarchaeota archaeon]
MIQEQNQPKLEERLLQIGAYTRLSRGLEKSSSNTERYQLYKNLAGLAASEIQDPALRNRRYKEAYGDIRVSPEEAVRYALENKQDKINETQPLYNGGDKEKILEEVVSEMKGELKGVKNGAEAAAKLATYLTGLYDAPKLGQGQADEYAQEDAADDLGVSMNFSARGNIGDYRNRHESLYARMYASQFMKEIKDKDKKVTGYELDEKKVKEFMKDIDKAAVIYSNTKAIKEFKKEQKEAEKKAS